MASAETRSVNRCTYTPVSKRGDVPDSHPEFRPEQPFLKLALLATVFDDEQIGPVLLDRAGPTPRAPELSEALHHLWDGDASAAARALRNVDVDDLVDLSARALDAHDDLLREADEDLDVAVAAVAEEPASEAQIAVDLTAAVSDAVGSLRSSLLEELRAPVGAPDDGDGPTRVVLDLDGGALGGGGAAAPTIVRTERVITRLQEASPRSATLLRSGATFVRPRLAGVDLGDAVALYTKTAAERARNLRKRDILRSVDLLGLTEPLGFLHLERLQFTPVGYVRGDLVYSLPLLPGETVRVRHREWTRTETEFSTLVATSLETARQDSLSEKSELTESVTAQQQHSTAFNSSVTASGGFGPVNVSSSVGYNVADAESNSRTSSSRHAQEITKQASSRSKKEHKVSFRVTTTTEVEDESYREISNTSADAVRWDFHRLMRKWQIDLYRYDIRATYDVLVPEPGSYLLRRFLELRRIEAALAKPFALRGNRKLNFDGSPLGINRRNWADLATFYDAALEPPLDPVVVVQANAQQVFSGELVGIDYVDIAVPDGYVIHDVNVDGAPRTVRDSNRNLLGHIDALQDRNRRNLRVAAQGNTFQWAYLYDWSDPGGDPPKGTTLAIGIWAVGTLDPRAVEEWQVRNYERLIDAAKNRHEARRAQLFARRDQLLDEIGREDALSLRKIEREEIMKGVLRWVLGHRFEFYPSELPDLDLEGDDLELYSDDTGRVKGRFLESDDPNRPHPQAEALARYSQQIRFLQHAVEWENVNYVLYPYFWTDPERWDLKQALHHPDFEHRNFLRAGAARVVITIRPSYEKAFLSFMETGSLEEFLPGDHRYITVANEMKAYATTNDRYTSAANEENPDNHVDRWFEFTPTGALDVVAGTVLADDA